MSCQAGSVTLADIQNARTNCAAAEKALIIPRTAFARLIYAPVAITLLLGPHIASLSPNPEPFSTRWLTVDAGLLIWCVALTSLGCIALGAIVRQLNKTLLTRLVDHVFVIAFLAGILANVRYHLPHPGDWVLRPTGVVTATLWLIMLAAVGYSLAKPTCRLVLRCRQLCQIVTPVALFLVYRLAWLSGEPPVSDPLPPPAPPAPAVASSPTETASPVYLFVFDALMYQRTYSNGLLRPKFKNLAELSRDSITFHTALSCGRTTMVSLPRLLFQMPESDTPVYRDGEIGFERDGKFLASRDLESIFSAVADRNYRTAMVGCTVPYRALLAGKVDVCRSYAWPRYFAKNRAATTRDLPTKLRVTANHVMGYWTDPWTHWLHKRLDDRNPVFLELYENIKNDTMYFLTQQPRNTFAIFHLPLPHWPWIVKEDGSFHGSASDPTNLEGYTRNLRYTDRLIGEFVDALKRVGTYDDALIIITSDHIWHTSPGMGPGGLEYWTFHVPLVVKLPHQSEPMSVSSRFECQNLRELIRIGLKANGDPSVLEPLIELAAVKAATRSGPLVHESIDLQENAPTE